MEDHALLNECFTRYIEIKNKTDERRRELHGLQQRRDALLDLLVFIKGQRPLKYTEFETESTFPIVLGKAHSKFSLTSIGILPPEEYTSFYNAMYIYPIGYKIKRKYASPEGGDQKLTYFCQVRSVNGECIFEIRATGGKHWAGPRDQIWDNFSSEFQKMSFSSLEEFFGLTNETTVKLIEEMGDISIFSTYVPMKMRTRKVKKTKKDEN
ncbi:hypothetical protein NEPAR06_2259 [Nematocida parisii]|uniref:Uncharacterized protein n=1 Tax=Nematocida parisii (strain ERTm3) TaxID=935791 RepID=I3EF56_NEMP3|nr:uncharacterized protein NEPG_02031 [Nematocida parisii ERTm1]EIJ87853.1 hypothetical protein NEQG_01925 [Nematocida parisii ERTm3]KAI5129244.1 hypothetical protein NEPAR03_1605 [Nematocida parisii]EIJ93075.1 hypothetical protein NEPG_02031 [Nematocida parisii ERTm1]KAI5129422.1 hypothetical protein NEPAR08_1572 [Nematocida parisii]KAI5141977.1 hypothetical protein NEPAR04_1333 [Nematocida parisii]|eukprot:XP_013059858.1 hypothetical protein NEPG_02031 [Nematocida parisii ERTm1]